MSDDILDRLRKEAEAWESAAALSLVPHFSPHVVLLDTIAAIEQRDAEIARLQPLVRFTRKLLTVWQDGDRGELDGGQIQDLAEEAGVIVAERRTEVCQPDCACAEFAEPGEPFTCYRIIDGALAAQREEEMSDTRRHSAACAALWSQWAQGHDIERNEPPPACICGLAAQREETT